MEASLSIIGGALVCLAVALFVGPVREIFRFGPLSAHQVALAVAAAAACLALQELGKSLWPPVSQRRSG